MSNKKDKSNDLNPLLPTSDGNSSDEENKNPLETGDSTSTETTDENVPSADSENVTVPSNEPAKETTEDEHSSDAGTTIPVSQPESTQVSTSQGGGFIHHHYPKGIGEFDIKDITDRGFAFDYDSSGYPDHIVFYRPNGTNTIWILKNNGGHFTPVYKEGAPGNGIGGYVIGVGDKAFAFDYAGNGCLDHIVFHNTSGSFCIVGNAKNNFKPVYKQTDADGENRVHITEQDQVFPFDYEGIGYANYLAIYRPGTGNISFISSRDLAN